MESKNYTYRIFWSDEDQNYVGECHQFDGLYYLAPSKKEAFEGIKKLVANVLEDIKNGN